MKEKLLLLVILLSGIVGLILYKPQQALAAGSSTSVHGSCGETFIDTAIGCIPVLNNDNGTSFSGFILKWAIGVGGGVAFFLIVYAGFMIMTSQGNPERLKAGQELLTSAISGVVLLVLCVFILNVIGVKILIIPGFGK